MSESRIAQLIQAVRAIKAGRFSVIQEDKGDDELALLSRELKDLGGKVQSWTGQMETLFRVTEKVNSGFVLEDVLQYVYDEFRSLIPYDRIGFALIEESEKIVRSSWARFDGVEQLHLNKGYSAPLDGSSLSDIILTGQPRILNDLEEYLRDRPGSESTRLILKEGIRSSLTCPLVTSGKAVGFIFFSSRQTHTYQNLHVETFKQIAGQLSVITNKSRMYQRLLELDDLKNRFLGIAAHDLRSPLTVIKGNIDLLEDGLLGPLTDAQSDAVQRMNAYCESMLQLINDLLNVSTIESGRIDLKIEDVDMEKFLTHIYEFNGMLAQTKNISLKLDLEPDLPWVRMDPARMTQVLNNLISNAIKFSLPGKNIILAAKTCPGQMCVDVVDEGQGIPAEERHKLFSFFGKTSVRPTQGEFSSGLGLAIVKKLVEAHQGQVSVKSQEGLGSTFSLTLPL